DLGRLPRGQPGVGAELALVEDLLHLRRARLVRRLRVLRGERGGVLEDRQDVLVAADDPVAELLAEEHGLLRAHARVELERVGDIERVELASDAVRRTLLHTQDGKAFRSCESRPGSRGCERFFLSWPGGAAAPALLRGRRGGAALPPGGRAAPHRPAEREPAGAQARGRAG